MEELNNEEETKEEKLDNVKEKSVKKAANKATVKKDVKEDKDVSVNEDKEKTQTANVNKDEKSIVEEQEEVKEIKEETIEKLDRNEIEQEKEPEEIYNNKVDTAKGNKNRNTTVIAIISIAIILILAILTTGFALLNINNEMIVAGVKINGIEMQGLSRKDAVKKLTQIIEENIEKDIKIKGDGFEHSINGAQIEAKCNIEQLVEEAYSVGRNKNIFANNFEIIKATIVGKKFDIELEYNHELLNEVVKNVSVKIPNLVKEPSYYIEGKKLIITKGTAGNTINKDKLAKNIIDKILNNDGKDIELNLIEAEPKEIDIDEIYKEVYKEPQDAYYIKEPYQVFAHVEGLDFDLEKAREVLKKDKKDYKINLIVTMPKVTTNEIGIKAFPHLLSSFSTKYDASNKSRSTNLELAAKKLDGVVVMPGEEFSYNKTLGERTIEDGYKEALGYIGGKVVPTLAGGICQISSTLYDAVVYANLDIVERRNHMFLTSYVTAGKDATVAYGSIDFKFKNTRKYPIKIKANVNNGVAKIQIYGVKEEIEYEVEISTTVLSYIPWGVVYETNNSLKSGQEIVVQSGMSGCRSITYKILRLDGKQVSSEVLSRDTYDALDKVIQRGPASKTNTKKSNSTNTNKVENTTKPNNTNKAENSNKSNDTNEPINNTDTVD